MGETFALGTFLAHWTGVVRHDLATSDSESCSLAELLDWADDEDRRRWLELSLGYASPRGAAWLRDAIASRHPGLGADDVLCCAGAQEAVSCVARALLRPEDHAVLILPIYEPSERVLRSLCPVTGVALEEGSEWRLDLGRLAAAVRPNTRLVLANFPNSPTGSSIDETTLTALVDLCRRRGLWLLNDEVYRQTDSGSGVQPPAVVEAYERGISVNGLSKGFGLPGLRVGWAACRDRGALSAAVAVKGQLSSCLASSSEVLAHIALKNEARIVDGRRTIGQRNYARLAAVIGAMPEVFEADPLRNLAFSFPRYLGRDGSDRFAARLAEEAGILVTPSTLWRTSLAGMPEDRIRIGLGHLHSGPAIDALGRYAEERRATGLDAALRRYA